MNSDKFIHRLKVEKLASTSGPDSFGAEVPIWTNLFSTPDGCHYASIEGLSGRELLAAQQISSDVTHKIGMWYYPGITPKMRGKWDSRTFNFLSVIDPDGTKEQLHIMAVEEVG